MVSGIMEKELDGQMSDISEDIESNLSDRVYKY